MTVLSVLRVPGISFEIPLEVVVIGLITGLTYGLTAVALVMVYRVSRIINFSHGVAASVPALLLAVLVLKTHVPYVLAFPIALGAGGIAGAALEWLVIRRLQRAPRLSVMVATIAAAQVLAVLGGLIPTGTGFASNDYPVPFQVTVKIGSLNLHAGELMVLAVAPVVIVALAWFQRTTNLGIASQATAENVEAAALTGIPVKRVSLLIWTVAGLFAALSGVLVGGTRPVGASMVPAIGAGILVRALAAGLFARLDSYGQAFAAGIGIGIVEALLTWNYPQTDYIDIVLLCVVVACLLFRKGLSQAARGGETSSWSLSGSVRALRPSVAVHPMVRLARWIFVASAVAAPILWSTRMTSAQQVLLAGIAIFALMGLSLVVLTGFAGQISLGQATFVGIGAHVAGRMYHLGFPLPTILAYAVVAGGAVALALGVPALRIRGLYLAVVTIVFAAFAEGWLFRQPWVLNSDGTTSSASLPRQSIFGLDIRSEQHYAWFCIAMLVMVGLLVHRIRAGGVGRALIAVRDNEAAAATMSLSPRRMKCMAFGLSGMIAGLAGALYAGLLVNFAGRNLSGPDVSLSLVVMVILGGVTTVTGAVLGALWVKGIPYFLGTNWATLSSGIGVLIVLLKLQGGLAELAFRLRDLVVSRITGQPVDAVSDSAAQQGLRRERLPSQRRNDPAPIPIVLEASDIYVRYGGNIVLNGVSVNLIAGEVLGILGPNGAGKTTLFDVLTGQIRPGGGIVRLHGGDVTRLAPEQRAQLGLGRTFQQARLFDELTLFECIQVALERQAPTEATPALLGLPPGRRLEAARKRRAGELIELLGLQPFAHREMTALSTGTRRMAELAAVMAMGADVILLDEPTAGIAQAEVERFAPVIRELADHLDASVVVIEHDIPLMMSLVDRLYVLAAGEVIAEGPPMNVGTDPAVIAAYLGTDERAVVRSGQISAPSTAAESSASPTRTLTSKET